MSFLSIIEVVVFVVKKILQFVINVFRKKFTRLPGKQFGNSKKINVFNVSKKSNHFTNNYQNRIINRRVRHSGYFNPNIYPFFE